MAAAKHIELPAVSVPSHLWTRSGRPMQGRIVQVVLPGALIIAGSAGVGGRRCGWRWCWPVWRCSCCCRRSCWRGWSASVATSRRRSPKEAAELLQRVPASRWCSSSRRHAWRTLHEGILQLKVGDGKSAAANFAETARLIRQPEAVMLVSAQAHALVVAANFTDARELLQRLAKENMLVSRDQLDLGIVLLVESQKKNKQALAYIEAARKTIGDHPRVLAAMALALQKTERIDEASELLEQVQIIQQGADIDPVVEDLVKRARKGLQTFIEAQLRRERRSRSRRTTIVVSSDLAASEIVSGEIGAGDQAQLDNPTTSFRPGGDERDLEQVGRRRADGRGAIDAQHPRVSARARRKDARASRSFSIEEDSAGHEEPEPEPEPVAPAPLVAKADSILTAISAEPAAAPAPQNISLINPAAAAPPSPTIDASKILPDLPIAAIEPPPPPAKLAEVDVPVFRRKQTFATLPAVPDRPNQLGALPTGGNSLPGTPSLSGLPVAGGPKSALPTRRPEAPNSAAPKSTTPMFRAPVIGKLDDKAEGDEGNEPGRR
jgi:tetratricopeptide (TPR) repeat protein